MLCLRRAFGEIQRHILAQRMIESMVSKKRESIERTRSRADIEQLR